MNDDGCGGCITLIATIIILGMCAGCLFGGG